MLPPVVLEVFLTGFNGKKHYHFTELCIEFQSRTIYCCAGSLPSNHTAHKISCTTQISFYRKLLNSTHCWNKFAPCCWGAVIRKDKKQHVPKETL